MEQRPIKEQIGLLINLQAIDGQIYAMSKEKASIPGHLKSIDEALEFKKTNIKQAEENLKNIQLKQKEKEKRELESAFAQAHLKIMSLELQIY